MLQSEKEKLMKKTVDELRKICKEKGISYYSGKNRLTKVAMVDKLIEYINENEEVENSDTEPQWIESGSQLPEWVEQSESEENKKVNKEEQDIKEKERLERRKRYIENAKVGNFIAFSLPSGKVISAMIIKKSTSGRKFLVTTKYNIEHKVSFDDVIWVKCKKEDKWPRGVFLLFNKENNKEVNKNGKDVC